MKMTRLFLLIYILLHHLLQENHQKKSILTCAVAGSGAAGTAANGLFQQLEDYIDFRVNGASGDSTTPTPEGTNTPTSDTGYLFAQECIEANRTFLKDEAVAYINATYPSYTYSEAACKRDVDRYLDGVIYDLKYTLYHLSEK